MKSFNQFKSQINELFDKPARWQLTGDTRDTVDYQSNVNGKDLAVVFDIIAPETWEVIFAVDSQLAATGEGDGDEMKVFSTVLDIISDFIKNKDPEQLYFTAEKSLDSGRSRIRLYNRLVNRFASSHGYRLKDKDDGVWEVSYTLVKV
jgi:hypothetical protein